MSIYSISQNAEFAGVQGGLTGEQVLALGNAVAEGAGNSWWDTLPAAVQQSTITNLVSRLATYGSPILAVAQAGAYSGELIADTASRISAGIAANPDAYNPLFQGNYNLTNLATDSLNAAAAGYQELKNLVSGAAGALNPIGWSFTTIIIAAAAVIIGIEILSGAVKGR